MIYKAVPQTEQGLLEAIELEVQANGHLRTAAAIQLVEDLAGYEMEVCDEVIEQKAKGNSRSISGIASIEEVSRTGLLINVAGIDLKHFKKNPVVLAAHRSLTANLEPAVIGLVGAVAKKSTTLAFRNMTFDTDPLSEQWFQKITGRFVRMVSVGIMPLEVEYVEEVVGKQKKTVRYVRIETSELLEISPCAVGANRSAFIDPTTIPSPASESMTKRIEQLHRDVTALREALDGDPDDEYQAYGDASFPDAAFVVEKGAPKEDGKTPQRYRHLPHHTKGVSSPTDNGTVDVPHLRNALARANQVKPENEAAASYQRRAEAHLKAHANAVLKKSKETIESLEHVEAADVAGEKLLQLAGNFGSTRE